jgi:hypothetical protein
MTKREIVLEQLDFIRANAYPPLIETIEQNFWLKMNEIFADGLKYSRVELWREECNTENQK